MKMDTLKITHKLILLIIFVSVFIGSSIMFATYFMSDKSRENVLAGASERLRTLNLETASEFNKAQEIASSGVMEASGAEVVEKMASMYDEHQSKYYGVVKDEIGNVADNVSQTLQKQNRTTNESLDNLLSVSTDYMNKIIEFDNASLGILSSMALFNVNNFKTISAEGLGRLSSRMKIMDALLWKMQEDSLHEVDVLWEGIFLNYGPVITEEEDEKLRILQAKFDGLRQNIDIRQRKIFKRFLSEFQLQSEIIAEEMRLLTDKVGFAINKEIENSTIIQDENIDRVITDLLLEKLIISDNIAESSVQVKDTINNLEENLLTILRVTGQASQQEIKEQTRQTQLLAEKTRAKVSEDIQKNTSEALQKIDETMLETNGVIENVLISNSKTTIAYSILLTILCASVAVFLGFFFIRSVTQPISRVLTFADKMSKGDFTERLPEGKDEMGEMARALNIMADEFVKLQEATLHSFNQTLDQVIDCVFMFDPRSLKFIYVNQGACDQVEYSRDELMNMSPLDIKPEFSEKRFQELLEQLRDGQVESHLFTTVHKTQTGKLVPVEVYLKYVVPPGNEPRYIAIVRDITEREKAKIERERMQATLLQAQKLESVGQLAAGIAHEINTPTQFIGTNIEFLNDAYADFSSIISTFQEIQKNVDAGIAEAMDNCLEENDWDYLKEEVPAAIEQSRQGVDRVSTIVAAMKNFSHPGSKQITENNLNEVIENTIIVASNEWKYVAEIDKDLDPGLPLVPCLVDEMGQVVLNLLVNGVHAIKNKIGENPEKVKGKLSISTRVDDGHAIIRISDDGCGIPDDVREKIFDPFFTTKEVGKGTGQGLAISHDVVTKKHGGTIQVQTETGVGTTFTISLPLKGTHIDNTEEV